MSVISMISRVWSLRNIEYTQPLIHRFLKTPPVLLLLPLRPLLLLVLLALLLPEDIRRYIGLFSDTFVIPALFLASQQMLMRDMQI